MEDIFSKDFPSDSTAVGESMKRQRKNLALIRQREEEVLYNGGDSVFHHYRVVGIVKDFNFETFKDSR